MHLMNNSKVTCKCTVPNRTMKHNTHTSAHFGRGHKPGYEAILSVLIYLRSTLFFVLPSEATWGTRRKKKVIIVLPITEVVHLIRYHSNSHHVHVPISRFLRPITSKLSLHCNNSLQTKRTYSRFENPTYYATHRTDVDGASPRPKSPLPCRQR